MWTNKHHDNIDWYERMASTGVSVKALDSRPFLTELEHFYHKLYAVCGTDFSNIKTYCQLYSFSTEDILETLELVSMISNRVK